MAALLPSYGPNLDMALIAELGRRVDALGPFDFELGPLDDGSYFALTPRGSFSGLVATRAIVARAPAIPGWTLYPAKPPKPWNVAALLVTIAGVKVKVDASAWEFMVYRHDDGLCDVLFRPPTEPRLPGSEAERIATTLVDGELGEERRMVAIDRVEVVTAWSDREAAAAAPLRPGDLARALERG